MGSLKKYLISNLACTTTLDELSSNKLVLLTAAGLIIGSPVFMNENELPNDVKLMSTLSDDIVCQYKKENNIELNAPTDGNDGFISLKNVSIKSGNSVINLPFLNVFFDQIIGVSIGNVD